jgi:HPt (histidine-containing phosphotransfer) domain-containing protein
MTSSAKPPPPPEPRKGDTPAALDLTSGVARVMGNRGLFARILERFRSDYRHSAAAIRAALAAGDTTSAQRLAHTLKGASGMLEANALQHQARALEEALRGPAGDLQPQLDQLEAELDRVLRELDKVLDARDAAQLPLATSAQGAGHAGRLWTAPTALARLRAMLDAGDGATVEFVTEARRPLSAALGDARLREVTKAINEFDYELALKLLDPPTLRR